MWKKNQVLIIFLVLDIWIGFSLKNIQSQERQCFVLKCIYNPVLPRPRPEAGNTNWGCLGRFDVEARSGVSSGLFDVEARWAISSAAFDVEARSAISSGAFDVEARSAVSTGAFDVPGRALPSSKRFFGNRKIHVPSSNASSRTFAHFF